MADAPPPAKGADPADDLRALLDPAYFSEKHFGWTPYAYQREVMEAVLKDGKRRIAWVAGRRVGKTDTVANVALQLAVRRPGTKVAIFAPTFKQAAFLSKRVRFHLEGSAFAKNIVVDKVDELRLRFGRDARGKPRDSVIFTFSLSGNVRGEGADVLIVDESAFCDSEDYRTKALPFITERPEAIVIHISTVWSEDDHFAQALREYDALSYGKTFRTPTRENPTVTAAMLEELRGTMLDSEYQREYECKVTAESGVFDRRALARCLRDYELLGLDGLERLAPRRHHTYQVGVDWGKQQDCAVIAVVEQGTQDAVNRGRLVMLEVYAPRPDSPDHYTGILRDVQRVAEHVKAHRVVADLGEGAHQAEVLRKALGGRFEAFRFSKATKDLLVGRARYVVENGLLELPMEPDDVRRAFLNVRREGDGYGHADRKLKDVFDAVALALSGVAERGGKPPRARMRAIVVDREYGLMMGVDPNRKPSLREDPRLAWITPEMWQYIREE